MKKLTVLLVGILLVFGVVGMANADFYSIWDITDPSPLNQSYNWTFDGEYVENHRATLDQMGFWWTNDVLEPYQNIEITEFDRTVDDFSWNIVDSQSGLDVDLYFSGILDLQSLTPGAVSCTLTPNSDSADLYFSASQINFDPPPQGDAAPCPEPATMFLLGTGILGMAGRLGRKKLLK